MQRLFPSFPNGWPGAGLLLLRAAVGATVAVQAAGNLAAGAGHPPWRWIVGAVALVAGALLLAGVATPIAAGVAAVIATADALAPFGVLRVGGTDCGLWLAIAALVLIPLGPGAFSLDAVRFGRREVVIPRQPPRGAA